MRWFFFFFLPHQLTGHNLRMSLKLQVKVTTWNHFKVCGPCTLESIFWKLPIKVTKPIDIRKGIFRKGAILKVWVAPEKKEAKEWRAWLWKFRLRARGILASFKLPSNRPSGLGCKFYSRSSVGCPVLCSFTDIPSGWDTPHPASLRQFFPERLVSDFYHLHTLGGNEKFLFPRFQVHGNSGR